MRLTSFFTTAVILGSLTAGLLSIGYYYKLEADKYKATALARIQQNSSIRLPEPINVNLKVIIETHPDINQFIKNITSSQYGSISSGDTEYSVRIEFDSAFAEFLKTAKISRKNSPSSTYS